MGGHIAEGLRKFVEQKIKTEREEYEEIMKIREEKIREKLIKELDKLCKNN